MSTLAARTTVPRFWESLTSVEANCLKDLLDAATLFQLELEQNEDLLRESKETLAARQAACDRLQRAAHRAAAAEARAAEAAALARRELRRLQETHQGADGTVQVEGLQHQRGEVQREEALVASELHEQQGLVQDLRQRLLLAKDRCDQRRKNFEEMRERCLQEKLEMKQIHAEDLMLVQKETDLALQKLEVKDVELANLAQEFHDEVHALRSALRVHLQRQSEHQQQRDEAQEELAARLQEGHSLRDFCRKTQDEVIELSTKLRVAHDQAQDLEESTDSEVESELAELQQRCHALERQCAHAQAAASRKPYAKLADLSFSTSEHMD